MTQITARDLVKKLSKACYLEARVTGDHHVFKHFKTGKMIVVPYSRLKDTIDTGRQKVLFVPLK